MLGDINEVTNGPRSWEVEGNVLAPPIRVGDFEMVSGDTMPVNIFLAIPGKTDRPLSVLLDPEGTENIWSISRSLGMEPSGDCIVSVLPSGWLITIVFSGIYSP